MIRAHAVNKIYKDGRRRLHVLNDVSIDLSKGEMVALMGPSGAGKSTLIHILGGIDKPTTGHVYLGGLDLYKLSDKERSIIRNAKIGFVFQFYHLLPEFTALENVLMPALFLRHGKKTKKTGTRAGELLERVGLRERLRHKPSELSGGEQQRVAIARALMNEPDVLLCDEPTGNLDSHIGQEILNTLADFNKNKKTTVLVATHDKEIAARADRIVNIKDGVIS